MTDGLSQLAQHGRRTREIPPPRNPARRAAVPTARTAETPAEVEDSSSEPITEIAIKPAGVPSAQAAPRPKSDLKVVTVYLEQEGDDFLETITHVGRTSRPKTAISRSAVVRLALERLNRQMSPSEIIEELRPRGESSGTGRKRR